VAEKVILAPGSVVRKPRTRKPRPKMLGAQHRHRLRVPLRLHPQQLPHVRRRLPHRCQQHLAPNNRNSRTPLAGNAKQGDTVWKAAAGEDCRLIAWSSCPRRFPFSVTRWAMANQNQSC